MTNNVTNLAEKMETTIPMPRTRRAVPPKPKKVVRGNQKTKMELDSFCKPNKLHCDTIVANAVKTSAGVMYACVPLELMDIDRTYQRKVVPSHINALKANWNDEAAGALIVSHRDDRFYVVDGQNRMFAAHALGKEMLHCQIHDGKTQKDEAKIFMDQDNIKRKLNGGDIIKSGVVAESKECVMVRDICAEFGINPYREYKTEMGTLSGANQAMRIVKIQGPERLRQIFALIRDCGWHMMPKAYSSIILCAFRNLCDVYEYAKVHTAVTQACKDITPTDAIITAQSVFKTARGPVNAMTAYLTSFIEK